MKRFFFGELAFSGKLTPAVSSPFSKSENGGLSLIHTLTNFHFRILGTIELPRALAHCSISTP